MRLGTSFRSPFRSASRAAVVAQFWGCQAALLVAGAAEWNQWLGGPERNLSVTSAPIADATSPGFTEVWRRPVGSGFSGVSVWDTNAVTAMTDGKQDVALLLDADTGVERWRFPLSRTKKRAEGVPLGPLSTPAIDADAAYVQALDGRFVCLDNATGMARWELNLKRAFRAHEPGYGFAGSPLLLDELVILLPAGASSAAAVALDRRTGEVRWQASLGSATEYASATLARHDGIAEIVAHLGDRVVGLTVADGRLRWQVGDVAGGLWTPTVLADGRVFVPLADESRLLEPTAAGVRPVWRSPVFEGAMGPVVEVNGLLVGHHRRRLTAVDAATGEQLWQATTDSDGQLVVWGTWLIFVNDRAGRLEVLVVTREGFEVVHHQNVIKPARMETPLTVARNRLYLRAPDELVALRPGPETTQVSRPEPAPVVDRPQLALSDE